MFSMLQWLLQPRAPGARTQESCWSWRSSSFARHSSHNCKPANRVTSRCASPLCWPWARNFSALRESAGNDPRGCVLLHF